MGGSSSSSSSSSTTQTDNRQVVGDGTEGVVIGPSASLNDVVLTDHGAIRAAGTVLEQGAAHVFDFAKGLSKDILSKVTDVVAEERADDVKELSESMLKFAMLATVSAAAIAWMVTRKK
ncbi:MAG: hypothetical protein RLW87_08005 [Alphaproteobacteria bacterium]